MSNRLIFYGKGSNKHKNELCDLLCPRCGDNHIEMEVNFYEPIWDEDGKLLTRHPCGIWFIVVVCHNCEYSWEGEKENHGKWKD